MCKKKTKLTTNIYILPDIFFVLLFFIFGILIFQKGKNILFSFFLVNYIDYFFFRSLRRTLIRFLKLILKIIGGRGPSVL